MHIQDQFIKRSNHCLSWLAIGILSIAVLATPVLVPSTVAQPLPDWDYYRAVTIDNTGNPEQLVDYQVKVVLSAANFTFSAAAPSGADLRFLDEDMTTTLSYWIEIWDAPSEEAVIWVKVPSIPPASEKTIYLYYGNAVAPATGDGENTFIFFDSFEDFGPVGMNSPAPLVTPTYDGSGQVVHPDVVYVPGGWGSPNSYEYWMGMTPYPNSNDDYENPSIIASNDNDTWVVPPGVTNPLFPEPAGHNDDPDMLLVDIGGTDTLVMYFNETNDNGTTYIRRLTSTDGVNWSSADAVLTMPNYVMSPTVIYDAGTYTMWYCYSVGGCTAPSQNLGMRTSTDGINWSAESLYTIDHPGRIPWHLDVQKQGDTYYMLFISYPAGSSCGNTNLYYAESSDGIAWTANPTPLLTPTPVGWDSANIYRASFLIDGTFLRIWYSARATSGQWRIGYTEGELDEFLDPPDKGWDAIEGNAVATTDYPRTGSYGLREIGGTDSPRVLNNVAGRVCCSVWLYELDPPSTATGLLTLLRIFDDYDISNDSIGAGVWVGSSTSNFSHHTVGFTYTPTSVPRTTGWHRLSAYIDYTDDAIDNDICHLVIDDQIVVSLDELDESSVAMSLEGYLGGTGWFDDAYVRAYTVPEPSAEVGSAQDNVPADPIITILPAVNGPISCVQSVSLVFHYEPGPETPAVRSYSARIQATGETTFNHTGGGDSDITVNVLPAGADNWIEIVENGDNDYTINYDIIGETEGITTAEDLFSIEFHGATTGAGEVMMETVLLRDLDSVPLPVDYDATASVEVDCDAPAAATNLSAAPGHEKVIVSWADPADADLAEIEIWRGLWHDGFGGTIYPEYDDVSNVVPTRPASLAEADASTEWELAGTVAAGIGSFEDDIVPRGVYLYEIFPFDFLGTAGSPAAASVRATNYVLGDMTQPYDGLVSIPDIASSLALSYGEDYEGGANLDYNAECDVGPTYDLTPWGIPTTDDQVQFEDLVICAINFGGSPPDPTPEPPSKVALEPLHLAWYPGEEGVWVLSLTEATRSLQALNLRIDVTEADLVEANLGADLQAAQETWFIARNDDQGLDLAVARLGAGGLLAAGTELLRIVASGEDALVEVSLVARDAANRELEIALTSEPVLPPSSYRLYGNVPNPFNPRTEIRFDLPEAQPVRLTVYDMSGRVIRRLVARTLPAGQHQVAWSGADDSGRRVPSGVYFYSIEAGPLHETGKMLMLK